MFSNCSVVLKGHWYTTKVDTYLQKYLLPISCTGNYASANPSLEYSLAGKDEGTIWETPGFQCYLTNKAKIGVCFYSFCTFTHLISDLLNGSKSPVIPSPPPPSANSIFDHANFLSHFPGGDKQQNIEFGIVGQKLNNMNNNPFVTALINNAASLEKNRGSRKYLSMCFIKILPGVNYIPSPTPTPIEVLKHIISVLSVSLSTCYTFSILESPE